MFATNSPHIPLKRVLLFTTGRTIIIPNIYTKQKFLLYIKNIRRKIMKTIRTRFVAVEYNQDNGTCKKVLSCVNLTENDYQKLLNESLASKQHGLAKAQAQRNELDKVEKDIENLYILLAKSTFDNLVDRGLIEDDEQLQQDFFDYVLEEKEEFTTDNELFKKILNKIRGI
jgi:hypothetical protein